MEFSPQTKLNGKSKGQGLKTRTYNFVSRIDIPELLMNIISCHGSLNDTKSAVILSCSTKLGDYYLENVFFLVKIFQTPFRTCLYL